MKRLLLVTYMIIMLLAPVTATAQRSSKGSSSSKSSSSKLPDVPAPTAWSVIQPLGLRETATVDTTFLNYSDRSIPSMISSAWTCTGNLGAEGINSVWMEREPMSDFFFRDAIVKWIPTSSTMKWYNSRIPFTQVSYNSSGGKENIQERLKGDFSGNINKRAQVGALIDYIYSKGSYANQATKDLIWGFSGSYIGDRFEFQGFYNHYNLLNKENGGITDSLYILDPAQLQAGEDYIDAKAIPTRLNSAHTRYVGGELYLNSRYKIGYWRELPKQSPHDTIDRHEYVPVTSIIWTLNYNHGKHLFLNSSSSEDASFFENTYLNTSGTRDVTSYYSLKNTVGLSLLEGFHKYAKFGLAAFVTHEIRKYTQTADTLAHGENGLTPFPDGITGIVPSATQNLAYVGGQLTKQRGSLLTYDITGELGILGDAVGDVKINGVVTSRFKLFGDTVGIQAYGRFTNTHAPYLMNNYLSNHFIWQNDFGKERSLKLGGALTIPFSGTRINVGVENLQNHIYFGSDFLPHQASGSVQIFSATLEQNIRAGAFNWENRITYQTTTNDEVVPLPKIAAYSNMYLRFRIATLRIQFGIDGNYYTSFYAPLYQPATMGFANQRDTKVGNYPFMNLYANMKLSKVRFYVMMSHINQGLTGKNYFSMPNYPLNPRRFQIGLSIDFLN